ITFTLVAPGGATVDSETVKVNGNGVYTTPTGFTLPSGGAVTGTYQWDEIGRASCRDRAISENNDANEQVKVSAAVPKIFTARTPTTVTLATGGMRLCAVAGLETCALPTGSISSPLFHSGAMVHTETVEVNGNAPYTTPTGFTLPSGGAVTGTYQWDASYSGDPNNNAAIDNNSANDQATVSAASPTIFTAPTPTTVTLGTSPLTLTDLARLATGFNPSGSITFTLFHTGPLPHTAPFPANGNAPYTTPTGFTLPSGGAATGTYQWDASYSGDPNNNAVSENDDVTEQVTVSAASPTIFTTPTPTTLPAGDTLTTTAVLQGGFNPT